MDWKSHETFNALIEAVYKKYNEEFWGEAEAWSSYLRDLEIVRSHKRRSPTPVVYIECPWSVHNSPVGSIHGKIYLYIPMELAEKIVMLGAMPPTSSPSRP